MAIALSNVTLPKLLVGYKKFYLDQHFSLKRAYEETLVWFFSIGYEHRQGVLVPILPPFESLPTLRQFAYRGQTHYHSASPDGKNPRLSAKPLGRRPNHLKSGYAISSLPMDKSVSTISSERDKS